MPLPEGACVCLYGRRTTSSCLVCLHLAPFKIKKKRIFTVSCCWLDHLFSPLERRVPPFGRRLERPLKKENRLNGFCTHIQCLLLVFLSLSTTGFFFFFLWYRARWGVLIFFLLCRWNERGSLSWFCVGIFWFGWSSFRLDVYFFLKILFPF